MAKSTDYFNSYYIYLIKTFMKKAFMALLALSLFHNCPDAQLLVDKDRFSRGDTLRGKLSPLRSCYDINYYHLDVKFDIDNKFISGSNLFQLYCHPGLYQTAIRSV